MLEMSHRVSDKKMRLTILKKPHESRVGAGKRGDEGRFIELQDGRCRFAL
jgi:hypothetical protein